MPSTSIRLCAAMICALLLAPAARAAEPVVVTREQLLTVAGSGGDDAEIILPPDALDPNPPPAPAKSRTGLIAGTAALYAAGIAGFVTGGVFLAARNQTRTDFLARPSFTKAELDDTTARA